MKLLVGPGKVKSIFGEGFSTLRIKIPTPKQKYCFLLKLKLKIGEVRFSPLTLVPLEASRGVAASVVLSNNLKFVSLAGGRAQTPWACRPPLDASF